MRAPDPRFTPSESASEVLEGVIFLLGVCAVIVGAWLAFSPPVALMVTGVVLALYPLRSRVLD